jgi:hypothetical protein
MLQSQKLSDNKSGFFLLPNTKQKPKEQPHRESANPMMDQRFFGTCREPSLVTVSDAPLLTANKELHVHVLPPTLSCPVVPLTRKAAFF